jgi:hypothetical protein
MVRSSVIPDHRRTVTDQGLTDELARRVMHWKPGLGRFLKSGRQWISRWRFQPLSNIDHAFQLLNAGAGSLVLRTAKDGSYLAQVKLEQRTGCASSPSVATSISVAMARALGLDVPDEALKSFATKPLRRKRDGQRP